MVIRKKDTNYPSIDKTHEKQYNYFDNNPIIPSISIFNAINLISKSYSNEIAVNSLELNKTFKSLIKDSALLSKAFKELGIKKDDIIVVSMPNYYQAVITFFAANRIGATTTFLNSFSSKEEISNYLNLFESPLFINYNKSEEYNKYIKNNTKVKQIITLYEKDLNKPYFNDNTNNFIGYNDFISFNDTKLVGNYYKKPFTTLYGGKENALILYTSGTTGNPKSVVLTNENILASGIYMKNSTNLSNTKGEKSLVCVPFTYPYGFSTSTLMSLLCGRQAILAPDLSSENIKTYLKKNPNIIFGSPALLELIKRNTPENQDLSSITTFISGGDFLTETQAKEGKEFFKKHNAEVTICNGSGNAETVGASTNSVGIKIKPETVGKILVGTKAIVINPDTMKELKYGEEGLLCISGKHVFKEYYKEPKLTQDSKFIYKGNTYFKTGTRGKIDKEGYFTLTGRDSRYYIISTLNKVYCDRVQLIMSRIDCIEAVAIVEKPDKEMLFTNKAFIVLKEGIKASEAIKKYILRKCTETLKLENGEDVELKEYEIPSSIEFVEKLPRTKADKIDYNVLKENAINEYKEEQHILKLK